MIYLLTVRPLISINCADQNIPPSLAFDFASVSASVAGTHTLQSLDS